MLRVLTWLVTRLTIFYACLLPVVTILSLCVVSMVRISAPPAPAREAPDPLGEIVVMPFKAD